MFIITKDLLYDPETDDKSAVGIRSKDCPSDLDVNDIEAVKKFMPIRFRLLDDDKNPYFEGYYNGVKSVSNSEFEGVAKVVDADIEVQRKWFDAQDDFMSNMFRQHFPDGSTEDFAFSPLNDFGEGYAGCTILQVWVTGKGGGWKII